MAGAGADVPDASRAWDFLENSDLVSSAADVHSGVRLIIPVFDSAVDSRKETRAAQADGAAPARLSKTKKPKHTKADDLADAQADAPLVKPHDKAKAAQTAPDKPIIDANAAAKPLVDVKGAKPAQLAAQIDNGIKVGAPGKKKPLIPDVAATGSVHAGDPAPKTPLTGAQADASGVSPEFRWPARGRIIQGFKTGGNDGINIAVPEGTSVKAAESGVVAYAGSELKGYGNLVLIRHPNGFVSAYANNGELSVKRGETVKRGQIIAKSGQSGNVNSPQLHFELRKGSTPVDPTSYLAGL